MADPITREQVERAIEQAQMGHFVSMPMHFGPEWRCVIPAYVRTGYDISFTELVAALTRWHAELVAAETPRKAPDDTAPERLRERREALGWNQTWAAEDINRLHGFTEDPWGWRCVASCEEGSASAIDRARYAAALSAAEAERAAKPDHLAYADSPVWDDGPMPKPVPATEVVDVPQPIVKRCACPDIHDDVEAEWQPGEPYLTVTHTTVPVALLRAMLAAIDAQQGGPPKKWGSLDWLDEPEPTRPEPRYKVGDWVRHGGGMPWQVTEVRDYRDCYAYHGALGVFIEGPEVTLSPALDLALHETARRAVAMLHKGEWPLDVPRVEDLPGFDEWNSGGMGSPSWAAQLERLLGDAP